MTLLYKTKTLLITIFGLISSITCQSSQYSYHSCIGPDNDTATASYKSNLTALLNSISSKASDHSFYNDSLNGVYSLFVCRGDVASDVCQDCVNDATRTLIERCHSNKSAIIWYDQCMLHYSNISFFGQLQLHPMVFMWNTKNNTLIDEGNFDTLGFFYNLLGDARITENMFKTDEKVVENGTERRYGLVQCSRDINRSECSSCWKELLDMAEKCCIEQKGWRILAPSCYIRYEMNPFYNQPSPSPGPPPKNEEGRKQGELKWIPIGASLSAIFGLTLFCSGGVFLWRRRNFQDHNSQEVQLLELGGRDSDDYSNENFQGESGARSQEFPSIQLDILQAATKQFCDENKLGEGGFGPVYKGKLADGKEIAVKRLSRTSGQGLLEFKNEVMLIAKLQHRNLVRLLGCCLEQNEKLLVYEYMPNKSLDVFLFDSSIGVQLDWQKRLGIINGIARGILYLHEDSRLRIIHRDLKASNVLLDHEMNPRYQILEWQEFLVENKAKQIQIEWLEHMDTWHQSMLWEVFFQSNQMFSVSESSYLR